MEIIKSITEAFSMQPRHIEIVKRKEDYIDQSNACKEIKFENLCIGYKGNTPVEELYYVGYNFEGRKIFQYIATSVNVHYDQINLI